MPDPSPNHFADGGSHRPALDGLRFLAFLAVFGFHAENDSFPCPWGWGGVRVFFTLSGFLITRILIRDESASRAGDLARFYRRRTLRIFPLYYALVVYFWLTGYLTHTGWFLTYLANVEAYWTGTFDTTLGHFWTLCVEEQFYLIFPPVFWFTPRRLRLGLIVALIVGSAGFQVYAHAALRMPMAKWLTPYCLSDLAWGALAGWIELRTRPRRGQATALVVLGLALLVAAWQLNEGRFGFLSPGRQLDLAPTTYGVASACLVFGLWRTTNPLLVGPLSVGPIAYLGRISYGLYAFHLPVLRGFWEVEIPYAFYVPRIYRQLLTTIVLAALSWRFFEGPINRLKERFEVRPGAGRA